MGFEVFTRRVQWQGEPQVTMGKFGRMGFNKAQTANFEKDTVENVLLLWDKERRLIGIKSIAKKDSRAYKLHPGVKGNGSGFSAAVFFKYIGYDNSKTRNFPIEWNEKEQMYLIEIPVEYLKQQRIGSLVTPSTTMEGETKGETKKSRLNRD